MPSVRGDLADPRRSLPSVDQVLKDPEAVTAVARYGRGPFLRAVRAVLAGMRSESEAAASNGGRAPLAAIVEGAVSRLTADTTPSLRRLINATGVVVHTNLGRAPLSPAALVAVREVASGYSNLEYDLGGGERGSRETHIEAPLRRLLAVESAAVVNNCAAAVLLAVNTFAEGRHVLVSRGELVEIGGSFRIPDILRKGGATLREVGTTNRTRLSDYQNALDAGVGLILRVHPSNFRIVGFTESPASRELAALARSAGIPLVEDLGSGLLEPPRGLESEATVRQSLEAGADVVTFSGDKLFGGPQAGFAVGNAAAVDAMRRNPLYRALRVDKMTIAALHATLVEHENERAPSTVPVLRMVAADPAELRRRAGAIADRLRAAGVSCDVIAGQSAVGGGAAPAVRLETSLVSLAVPGIAADDLAARLRSGTPPVVGRIEEGRLLFDPRTVDPGDEEALGDLILGALKDVTRNGCRSGRPGAR